MAATGGCGEGEEGGGKKGQPGHSLSPRASLSSLSTFIHNMLAFGLNKKLCSDFLKKQATIGNLDEGRREPGGCAAPSWDSGRMERGWDGSAASLSPVLSPPQSNTSCSVTTSSRWPWSSRLAGPWWPWRDSGRTGGEERGSHLRGYLRLKLGYLQTKPHTRAAIKPCMIVHQTLEGQPVDIGAKQAPRPCQTLPPLFLE